MTQHNTGIEWTHIPGFKGETWNPVVGCSVVSPGCTNCYAMRFAGQRLDGNPNAPHYAGLTEPSKAGPVWNGKVARASDTALTAPLRWRKPRAVFVNSMGDLFHEAVPDAWIDQVFAVMALCPQHVFIILTKRAERMRGYMSGILDGLTEQVIRLGSAHRSEHFSNLRKWHEEWWPLPNVWLGVSAEDQTRADERIPHLLATPAAVRLVSVEPMLGAVDLTAIRRTNAEGFMRPLDGRFNRLDWVICGGESGKGARPMHPDWARSLRDQCAAAGVPFFFKQWGEHRPVCAVYPQTEEERYYAEITGAQGDLILTNDGTIWTDGQPPTELRPWVMERVGKKAAGRNLDRVTHEAFPKVGDAS